MRAAKDALDLDQALEVFKFYEEAAEKTKGHAWSQTTWILTLNAGILAFSLNLFAAYSTRIPFGAFLVIEWISCIAGLALCDLLFFVIRELGVHIANYWQTANKLAAKYAPLTELIGEETAAKARNSDLHREISEVLYKTDVAGRLVHGSSRRVGDCRHGPDVLRIWPRRFPLRA